MQSALGSVGTRIGARCERHCADARPYKRRYMIVYCDLGALRFLWFVLWLNAAS